MTTTPTLNGQIIGQAERLTRAVLERLLAGAGVTFVQWVAINQTATAGPDGVATRLTDGLRIDHAEAQATVDGLAEAGLLAADGSLTTAGRARYDEISAGIAGITERLYSGLPADELATAGRVLSAVIARARSELATA
jgi:hypothetical protein